MPPPALHCELHRPAQVCASIAVAANITHAELELCLTDVLQLEGWDMATLEMPEKLLKRLIDGMNDVAG